ncbi:MAG: hypothetical protein HKM93_11300, partial [Desulfobacteraceae bacterium]|nr:hypothetical protein [Desulfobacteraceae bacterium]
RVNPGASDYVFEACGTGDGVPDQIFGWQQATVNVVLTAGTHTLIVGGYNTKKTFTTEITDIYIDKITVIAQSGATTETSCTDGIDNDGDGFTDCLDSDCDGISTCEFGAETSCADGIDNDGDGFTDCLDSDCDGIGDCGTVLYHYTFEMNSEGFAYSDDMFRSTSNSAYASGQYNGTIGYAGGGLQVNLGGIDDSNIIDGMSGGWAQDFSLTNDSVATITLRYRIEISGEYEPDECVQAIVAVDGEPVIGNDTDYLFEICGTGDGSPPQDSGWQEASFDLSLSAGSHSLAFGGWNSQKTTVLESANLSFDDVTISLNSDETIIFIDDFSSGSAEQWSVVDDAGVGSTWQVSAGKYRQTSTRVDNYVKSYHTGSFSVYQNGFGLTDCKIIVEADSLETPAGLRDSLGVMFRYTDTNNYYRLIVSRMQGFTRLEKRSGGVFETLALNGRGFTYDHPLKIELVLSDSDIFIYLNGIPVFSASDPDHAYGSIALFTQGPVAFDNFSVLNLGATPRLIVSPPTAYSIAVNDDLSGPYALTVNALTQSIPSNAGVQFTLDGDMLGAITTYTHPFTGTFGNVAAGDHTLHAEIVDQMGIPIGDLAKKDVDQKQHIGVGGKVIIAGGDSITNGVGDEFTANNSSSDERNVSRGYTPILEEALSGDIAQPIIVHNEGIGGATSAKLRLRLDETIDRYPNTQFLIAIIGSNDISGSMPTLSGVTCTEQMFLDGDPACVGTFKDNVRDIILNAIAEDITPILAKIPYRNDISTEDHALIQEYNEVIGDLWFEHSLDVIPPDLYTYFFNNQGQLSDGLHPTDDGYRQIAEQLRTAINSSGILD